MGFSYNIPMVIKDIDRRVPLSELIKHIPDVQLVLPKGDLLTCEINGIAFDSRKVKPGDVFVALVGGSNDGHRFIPAALERGALAVVGSQAVMGLPVPYIQVGDARQALAFISAAFYGYPGQYLTVIGVTGTDGKTTTTSLVYEIMKTAGFKVGMITTVNAVIGDEVMDTGFHVTTPESPDVQRYLARMAFGIPNPITHVIIESTSHGLAQHRVTACEFDIGVVTNITHEHLDYHGTFEEYREAKSRLFKGLVITKGKKLGNPRLAVLNRDDGSFEYLNSLVESLPGGVRKVSYGSHHESDYRADRIEHEKYGLSFEAHFHGKMVHIRCGLVGAYNVSNCLAAIATAVDGLGIETEPAIQGIAAFKGIPGRMERVDMDQDFQAIVDFAHTPNALNQALTAAREMTSGRVIAVFGSAGLRDRAKRRMMAEISAQLADITILTAEDPRTESLNEILVEMAKGMMAKGGVERRSFWRVPDRREAIRFAVNLATAKDLVIILGKGHEQSMCFGEIEFDWDDRLALKAALAERLGISGPKMPFLPEQ